MWDIIKHINICIMDVPEREESKKGTTTTKFKEIMLKTSQISLKKLIYTSKHLN